MIVSRYCLELIIELDRGEGAYEQNGEVDHEGCDSVFHLFVVIPDDKSKFEQYLKVELAIMQALEKTHKGQIIPFDSSENKKNS